MRILQHRRCENNEISGGCTKEGAVYQLTGPEQFFDLDVRAHSRH